MDENEGAFAVTLDELLDPKTSQKTGKPYFQISVRRAGAGVGDLFVPEEIYKSLKAAAVKTGAELLLYYRLAKINGSMEPRFDRVVIL